MQDCPALILAIQCYIQDCPQDTAVDNAEWLLTVTSWNISGKIPIVVQNADF